MTPSEFIGKFKSKYLWYNLAAMFFVVIILCTAVRFGLDIYTHHGESIIVPNLKHKSFDEAKQEYFHRINAMNLKHPRMIGFGISNKQTLESAQNNAAGAIIGSKFVTLLEESKDADEALDKLFDALKR